MRWLRYLRRLSVTALGLLMLNGCLHRYVDPLHVPVDHNINFADLEPGWRVRIVVPLLRSGGYILKSTDDQTSGNEITLDTKGELIGYQQSIYAVDRRDDGGVVLRFRRTEDWEGGKLKRKTVLRLGIVDAAENAKHVRLVYLLRGDTLSHDMALVFSDDPQVLNGLTEKVVNDGACVKAATGSCIWIPLGVGVALEEKREGAWAPAGGTSHDRH